MAKRKPKKRRTKKGRTASVDPGMRLLKSRRGLLTRIAERLKISRQAVGDWDKVPIPHLLVVEEVSEIDRSKLRPDIFKRRPKRKK